MKLAYGLCSDSAHGIPRGTRVAYVLLLKIEPMFIAHVLDATWANADVEMQKLVCRATGTHASFHIGELHRFKLFFCGPQTAAWLVIPASCR